nr:YqaJ viral recombinase family protein [Corynebacterium sp. UBA5992]
MNSRVVENPPAPGTPEWRAMVSGSKIATILGLSRFQSQYGLWHEMAGLIEPEAFPENLGAWGHIAENSLAEWWKLKHPGWQLNQKTSTAEIAYTRDDLGFPNIATLDRRARRGRAFHIIECKTARDLADWGRPGDEDAVPADYYAQVLWQQGISGIHQASIVVLGPFGEPEIHEIPWDGVVFDGMVERARAWMRSFKTGTPPPLDDSVRAYEVVRGLHPDIDLDEEVTVDRADAIAMLDAITTLDQAEADARAAKIRMAQIMGTAKKATVDVPGLAKPVKIADRRAKGQGTPWVQFNKKANLANA